MGVCVGKETRFLPTPQGKSLARRSTRLPIALVNIESQYKFVQVLGRGSFGIVREAVHIKTCRTVAIKSIPKERMNGEDRTALYLEIDILQSLDHPNIVKCFGVMEDADYLHIVMEKCAGGDLFDWALQAKVRSEEEVAEKFRKICGAVAYLHSLNISHRDIKAENILFTSCGLSGEPKLIDFGLSRRCENVRMHSMVGSPYYMSPEVIRGNYSRACDVWSIGVLLFIILFGHPPFNGKDKSDIFRSILQGEVELADQSVSKAAKNLLRGMLDSNERYRLTIDQVIEHRWMQGECCVTEESTETGARAVFVEA